MSASGASRSAYIGIACTIAASIGFSTKPVIVKLAYEYGADVMTLLALRMLLALPFLIAMAWWAGSVPERLHRREWATVLGLGFVGYYLASYLDLAGLQYISASLGRLILYLFPTVVLLLGALFLKQRITARHIVSLVLSYGGIALVFSGEPMAEAALAPVLLGSALVFGSAVSYAIYLIAGARIVQKLGSTRLAAYSSIAASAFVIASFALTHGVAGLTAPREVYALGFLLAVFSTVVPTWLMAEGLKRLGANQVALVACVGPISTIGLARVVLGEPVTAFQLAGAALVLAGILAISVKPQSR